jgi:uncharacterized membrane protein YcfT
VTIPAPRTGAAVGTSDDRLAWPDLAKGVCITLVVLWHVTSKALVPLPDAGGTATALWSSASVLLTPLRMPLFFAVSGYFAARAVRHPWRAVARGRIARPYYLHAVWLTVHTAVLAVAPLRTESAGSVTEFLGLLVLDVSNLWYLYALALYFVLARAGSRWPFATLAAAALVSAAVLVLEPPSWGNSSSLLQNAAFFLLGAYFPGAIDATARRARPATALAGCLAFAAASGAVHLVDAERVPLVGPGVALLGVWAGVTTAVVASRWRATGPLRRLGRLTLPVYVMHMPLLAGAVAALKLSGVQPGGWLLATGPAVATGALIATCLLVHRLLRLVGASFLFDLPGPGASAGRHAVARAVVDGRARADLPDVASTPSTRR